MSLLACLLFGLSGISLAADWVVPNCQSPVAYVGGIAYNTATHKVYAGFMTDSKARKGLLVYDTDAKGNIIGQGRRYLSHPNPSPGGNVLTWVHCIFFDSRHNKLFLGLNSMYDGGFTTPLVMYNLDASGEPTGQPQAFNVGIPYQAIYWIAQHPTLNRLYFASWGNWGINAVNQDANGAPTGTPSSYGISPYSYNTVHFRSDGSKCYLGGLSYVGGQYVGSIRVVDVDGNGNLNTGNYRTYYATDYGGYLSTSASDTGDYYRTASGTLAYWPLDANGEPNQAAPIVTATDIQPGFAVEPGNKLILTRNETFIDAIDSQTKVSGMRVKEYALNGDGSLGALLKQTGILERQQIYTNVYAQVQNVAISPDVAVVTCNLSGVRGNRLANLLMRTTLLDVAATGELYPYYTASQLNTGSYLK
jgi:hypothetical protein